MNIDSDFYVAGTAIFIACVLQIINLVIFNSTKETFHGLNKDQWESILHGSALTILILLIVYTTTGHVYKLI